MRPLIMPAQHIIFGSIFFSHCTSMHGFNVIRNRVFCLLGIAVNRHSFSSDYRTFWTKESSSVSSRTHNLFLAILSSGVNSLTSLGLYGCNFISLLRIFQVRYLELEVVAAVSEILGGIELSRKVFTSDIFSAVV